MAQIDWQTSAATCKALAIETEPPQPCVGSSDPMTQDSDIDEFGSQKLVSSANVSNPGLLVPPLSVSGGLRTARLSRVRMGGQPAIIASIGEGK